MHATRAASAFVVLLVALASASAVRAAATDGGVSCIDRTTYESCMDVSVRSPDYSDPCSWCVADGFCAVYDPCRNTTSTVEQQTSRGSGVAGVSRWQQIRYWLFPWTASPYRTCGGGAGAVVVAPSDSGWSCRSSRIGIGYVYWFMVFVFGSLIDNVRTGGANDPDRRGNGGQTPLSSHTVTLTLVAGWLLLLLSVHAGSDTAYRLLAWCEFGVEWLIWAMTVTVCGGGLVLFVAYCGRNWRRWGGGGSSHRRVFAICALATFLVVLYWVMSTGTPPPPTSSH